MGKKIGWPTGFLERDNHYYARKVIPPHLRAMLGGRTENRTPLGSDLKKALNIFEEEMGKIKQAIRQAEEIAALGVVKNNESAREHYKRELAIDHYIRREDGEEYRAQREIFAPAHEAELRKHLATGETALIEWSVDAFLESRGLTLDKSGAAYKELCHAEMRAQLEVIERQKERDLGDYKGEATDKILTTVNDSQDSNNPRALTTDGYKTLSEILPDFLKARSNMRPNSAKGYEVAIRMFEEWQEEPKPIANILRAEINKYKRALLETPANYYQRFPGMTLPEAVAANNRRAQPHPTISPNTIRNSYLANIRAVLNWAVEEDMIPDNQAAGIKVDGVTKPKSPLPFSDVVLAKVFGPPRFDPDTELTYWHWALLIALYTGARVGELGQMEVDDIFQSEGEWCFKIWSQSETGESDKKVKTDTSERIVPLHSQLIKLGFLDYIAKLRDDKQKRVFPEWKRAGSGKYADTLPKNFIRTYLKQVGVFGNFVFHSFRHTVKTRFAAAGVSPDLSDALCGHEGSGARAGYIHANAFPVADLKNATEKLTYPGLDLSHLYPAK